MNQIVLLCLFPSLGGHAEQVSGLWWFLLLPGCACVTGATDAGLCCVVHIAVVEKQGGTWCYTSNREMMP